MDPQVPEEECQAFRNCIFQYVQQKKKRLEKKWKSYEQQQIRQRNRNQQQLPNNKVYKHKLQKYQNATTHLTNHAIHILTTLSIKRHSLSIAIDAFLIICRECITLLQESFTYYQSKSKSRSNHSSRSIGASSNSSSSSSSSSSNSSTNEEQSWFRDILQQVLMHIFIQYIHIRDGFVLVTSGECRHTADSNRVTQNIQKQKNDFSSKLDKLAVRKDGYTKLFSSNCGYSGYGWDEFFNEEVGVRRRLLDELRSFSSISHLINNDKHDNGNDNDNNTQEYSNEQIKQQRDERNEIWDKLSEMGGAELFETAFDIHDNAMKDLQRKLEDYRKKILTEIQNTLSSIFSSIIDSTTASSSSSSTTPQNNIILHMVTQDKFERLELKNAKALGLNTWTIQRQGDTFKGKDKRGALPSNLSLHDWLEIMKISSKLQDVRECIQTGKSNRKGNIVDEQMNNPRPKKKRLVILDSDDEEDDDENSNNSKSNQANSQDDCLRVTFKEVDQHKSTPSSSSLHEIKRKLGVNIDKLQQSREGLEEEEKLSKKAAFNDETGQIVIENEIQIYSTLETVVASDQIANHNEAVRNESLPRHAGSRANNVTSDDREAELRTSNLKFTHLQNPTLPRNDLFRNAPISSNKEANASIVIGGDYRHSRQQNRIAASYVQNQSSIDENNKAFTNFGIHTNNDDLEETQFEQDEMQIPVKYRKWGDEVLEDLGLKADRYPACAPEKPLEMIQELGLQQ